MAFNIDKAIRTRFVGKRIWDYPYIYNCLEITGFHILGGKVFFYSDNYISDVVVFDMTKEKTCRILAYYNLTPIFHQPEKSFYVPTKKIESIKVDFTLHADNTITYGS